LADQSPSKIHFGLTLLALARVILLRSQALRVEEGIGEADLISD
jgi:hypothetical protein